MRETPGRPRWKRKRWVAGGVLIWLGLIYPASVGPAAYLAARGWIPDSIVGAYVLPVEAVYESVDDVGDAYEDYVDALDDLGEEHARGG